MEDRSGSLLGAVAGTALAPVLALGSFVRRARVFHPRGTVLWGRVRSATNEEPWRDLAAQLEGSVLVRFSGAWWKERQWPDVLGCALRFTRAEAPSLDARADDQDLLLATVRVPLTTLLAPLTTHVNDYLKNRYFGVSPFRAGALGRVKVRLSPAHTVQARGSRGERLDAALAEGALTLLLEIRPAKLGSAYRPLAQLALTTRVDIDQEQLRFDPYRSGRQLRPAGFVHGLRLPVYAASRAARPGAVR
jgi:hypothetical protein